MLRLTPRILEATYSFIRSTPPYFRWRLPDPDDIEFNVTRDKDCHGWFERKGKRLIIGISEVCVGHTTSLVMYTAHETVHLYQSLRRAETPNTMHNAEFRRLARTVCRHHGFDVKVFI